MTSDRPGQVPPPFVFPQVGERQNAYAVVLSAGYAKGMLLYEALFGPLSECHMPFCEDCNGSRHIWWSLYNALRRADKLEVGRAVAEAGLSLPEGPFEEEARG